MPNRQRKQAWTPAEQRPCKDALVESAVLSYIIDEQSGGMTIPMLALHFNTEFDQGQSGSAVERAVRELVRDGRLQVQGGKVVPRLSGPRGE